MNAPAKIEAATLSSAMAAAFAEIEGATKSANNPHFKSKYADLTSVIEAIKPALIKHSLFFTQHPRPSEGGVCIETVLHHAGGEHLSLGELFVPANKNDAQAYGSALTYARRYALVTAFGVPVEDDDGNAAARSAPRQNTQPSEMPDEHYVKIAELVRATQSNIPKLFQAVGVKAENLRALNQEDYAKCVAALEAKLARMAEEETNAKAKEAANG